MDLYSIDNKCAQPMPKKFKCLLHTLARFTDLDCWGLSFLIILRLSPSFHHPSFCFQQLLTFIPVCSLDIVDCSLHLDLMIREATESLLLLHSLASYCCNIMHRRLQALAYPDIARVISNHAYSYQEDRTRRHVVTNHGKKM